MFKKSLKYKFCDCKKYGSRINEGGAGIVSLTEAKTLLNPVFSDGHENFVYFPFCYADDFGDEHSRSIFNFYINISAFESIKRFYKSLQRFSGCILGWVYDLQKFFFEAGKKWENNTQISNVLQKNRTLSSFSPFKASTIHRLSKLKQRLVYQSQIYRKCAQLNFDKVCQSCCYNRVYFWILISTFALTMFRSCSICLTRHRLTKDTFICSNKERAIFDLTVVALVTAGVLGHLLLRKKHTINSWFLNSENGQDSFDSFVFE